MAWSTTSPTCSPPCPPGPRPRPTSTPPTARQRSPVTAPRPRSPRSRWSRSGPCSASRRPARPTATSRRTKAWPSDAAAGRHRLRAGRAARLRRPGPAGRGHRPGHGAEPQRRLLGPAAGGQLLLPGRVLRAPRGPVRARRAGDRVRRRGQGADAGPAAGGRPAHPRPAGGDRGRPGRRGVRRRPGQPGRGQRGRQRPGGGAAAVHPLHLRLRDRRGPARGGRGRRPRPRKAAAAMRVGPGAYLLLSAILFGIGVAGVLIRRNAIVVFMCVELMLNAVNLSFITFAKTNGALDGQVLAFFVMVVAAAEVVVGLGILVAIFRKRSSISVDDVNLLKG